MSIQNTLIILSYFQHYPPKEDWKQEKRHLTSSFDPLIGMSGPKIAPHPSEVIEPNLSADLATMSTNSGGSNGGSRAGTPRQNKVGTESPLPGSSSSGSRNSPFRVNESQISTADPSRISMNEGTPDPY